MTGCITPATPAHIISAFFAMSSAFAALDLLGRVSIETREERTTARCGIRVYDAQGNTHLVFQFHHDGERFTFGMCWNIAAGDFSGFRITPAECVAAATAWSAPRNAVAA